MHKLAIKVPQGKRAELVAEHGFDTKFGYHVVRLIGEVEQILVEGDIDLQRNNEQLKAIRRGEWTEERLRQWFAEKESHLERLYAESPLPAGARTRAGSRRCCCDCLEEHYGSLEGCVVDPDRAVVGPAEHPGRTGPGEGLAVSEEVMTMNAEDRLRGEVARHPYPLVFATISGAHLYGFPSPDSDYDLRGCHVLPVRGGRRPRPGPGDDRSRRRRTTAWRSTWSRTTPASSSACC